MRKAAVVMALSERRALPRTRPWRGRAEVQVVPPRRPTLRERPEVANQDCAGLRSGAGPRRLIRSSEPATCRSSCPPSDPYTQDELVQRVVVELVRYMHDLLPARFTLGKSEKSLGGRSPPDPTQGPNLRPLWSGRRPPESSRATEATAPRRTPRSPRARSAASLTYGGESSSSHLLMRSS